MRLRVIHDAATLEDADKVLADLKEHGVALLDARGHHVPVPPRRKPPKVVWDEEPKR